MVLMRCRLARAGDEPQPASPQRGNSCRRPICVARFLGVIVRGTSTDDQRRGTMSAQPTENGGNGDRSRVNPPRISHVVLRTTRLKAMIQWYEKVLRAQVLYGNDMIAFMTYDDEHHRIALFALPGVVEKPRNSAGLDHLAFFYPTMGDWIATYERLKADGITPRAGIHHGITMSLYYRDPDNNGIELSIDGIDKPQWHDWMRNELGKNLM